jgi:DNA adenine methylase
MINSPLKWIGGKAASAQRIVAAFPLPSSYDVYIEPCGGAAHVLLCKPPYQHDEVLNDRDGLLINFWRELQVHAPELREQVLLRPYARALYYDYYHSLYGTRTQAPDASLTLLEKAVRWFYILRSNMTGYLRQSTPGWTTLHVRTMKQVANQLFLAVQERIQYVAIDNRDVIDTILRYQKLSKRVFFYCDPPYFGVEHYYPACRSQPGGFNHEALATVLNTCPCPVALSYYPHPLVDAWYPADKWRRITWQQHKQSSYAQDGEGDMATEMLLCNYPAPLAAIQTTLFQTDELLLVKGINA